MADSPRYCAICAAYGDHHTDRHDEHQRVPDMGATSSKQEAETDG